MSKQGTRFPQQYARSAYIAVCAAVIVAMAGSAVAGDVLIPVESFLDDNFNGPSDVAMTADGAQLYIPGQSGGTIVILDRDPTTGTLSRTAPLLVTDPIAAFNAVAISPGAAHVYAVADGQVYTYGRDPGTGALAERGLDTGRIGLGGAIDIVVSPDGAHVYVAGNTDTAIVVYTREASSGSLTSVQALAGFELGGAGIDDVEALAISTDGGHVYAVRQTTNRVAHFTRDSATGFLSFRDAFIDEVENGNSMRIPERIALSGDGKHAYVTARANAAVSLFTRDSATGALTFVEAYINNIDATGLFGPRDLIVSPDGLRVYVTGFGTSNDLGGLVTFARDRITGSLTFLEVRFGSIDGVGAMSSISGIVVDPTGGNVYVASHGANAVQVFEAGAAASLTGTIIDGASRAGIGCAVIELTPSAAAAAHTAVTDLNGEYFFANLPPDSYSVRIAAVDYGQITPSAIDLSSGAATGQDYALDSQALVGGVTGTVTDSVSGDPLVGVFVRAFIGDTLVASTYTCANGQYELTNLAAKGTVTVGLTFDSPNYEGAEDTVDVPIGGTVESNQALEKSSLFPATLTGLARAADGESPIQDALITITGPVNTSTSTGSDGAYAFPALLEGLYTVHASATGFEGDTAVLNVAAVEITETSFLLETEGTTVGEPTDINGDDTVDAVDVQLVINAVLGLSIGALNADVNTDGSIDAVDVQVVINTVLGV